MTAKTLERAPDREFEAFLARPEIREWTPRFQRRRLITLALALLFLSAGAAGLMAAILNVVPDWFSAEARWIVAIFMLPFTTVVLMLFVWELVRKRRTRLKQPILAAAAEARGMTYVAEGFENPVGEYYVLKLAGEWPLSGQLYSDFFHGYYPDGAGFTFLDAYLIRGSGKASSVALKGTIHAYGRAGPAPETVVWTSGGRFVNFARPNGPWPRAMTGDPEFDDRFEIRALDSEEAKRLLDRTPLARFLLEQRRKGRIDAYIGPHLAVICIGERDRFEIGSLLSLRGAKARVRRMWDQVRESQEVLKRFRELVG